MLEEDILSYVRERFATSDPSVLTGTGPDDCAHVCPTSDCSLCITTDTLVEETHFHSTDAPEAIGRKAVAVNLSDLAASGCRPRWGVVAAALRRGISPEWILGLIDGMAACANEFSFSLVGGDTTSTSGPCVITVTACGSPYSAAPLSRRGARPGDALLVTGILGGSLLGKHLSFTPRVREMEWLLSHTDIHASMDISDGLALDLSRLLRESQCGAIIEASQIPISDAARTKSQESGQTALSHALSDGEDFELLFTIPPEQWEELHTSWKTTFPNLPLSRIGSITQDNTCFLQQQDGSRIQLDPKGYQHAFD